MSELKDYRVYLEPHSFVIKAESKEKAAERASKAKIILPESIGTLPVPIDSMVEEEGDA